MTEIKIDKGIKRASRTRSTAYPFEKMKIGDSFVTPGKVVGYGQARAATKKYKPKEFRAGFGEDKKKRIWRTK